MAADPLELAEERRQVAHVAQRGHGVDRAAGSGRVPSRSIRSVSMNEANRSPIFCASAFSSVDSSVSVGDLAARSSMIAVDLLLGDVGQLHERPPARPVRRGSRSRPASGR